MTSTSPWARLLKQPPTPRPRPSKLIPAPGSPHWNREQHKRAVELAEELCSRRPASHRKRIFEAFFGRMPKVKRGRGQRRNRRNNR